MSKEPEETKLRLGGLDLRHPPKWVWSLCGLLSLIAIVASCSEQPEDARPKSKIVHTIFGNSVSYLRISAYGQTGQRPALSISMATAKADDDQTIAKQADQLFSEYAGSQAADMGFRRVIVAADNGERPGVLLFGVRFSFTISVNTGDDEPVANDLVYDQQANGTWTRSAASAPPIEVLDDLTLQSGGKFALTSDVEDYPLGYYVFDCSSCTAKNASQVVSTNLQPLILAAIKRASASGLKKVSIAVFTRQRQTQWDFPTVIKVTVAQRRDGQWIEPKFTPQLFQSTLSKYMLIQRNRGEALRKRLPT